MRFVGAVLLVVLCGACAGGDLVSGDRRSIGTVTVVLAVTPAQARLGEPVRLTFRLSNDGGAKQTLTFPSAQKYDFLVSENGRRIWRWSDGQAFAQNVTYEQIAPQATITYSENWTPQQTGSFKVSGAIEAQGFSGRFVGSVNVK